MAIVDLETVKTFLQITDDTKDDLIEKLIPQVEADFLLIRNREFEDDSNDDLVYPDNAELVASQMIGYMLTEQAQTGNYLSSERIRSYSYSANTGEANFQLGYPKNIIKRIKRYVGVQ